jgi:hypothetical protein
VHLVERGADLLDVRAARHEEQLALDVGHLPVHLLERHLPRVRRQLDAEETSEGHEELRHLVARDVGAGEALGDGQVDRERKGAVGLEVALVRLGHRAVLGGLGARLGDLGAQRLVLLDEGLELGEARVGARVVLLELGLQLLGAPTEIDQLLVLGGPATVARRELLLEVRDEVERRRELRLGAPSPRGLLAHQDPRAPRLCDAQHLGRMGRRLTLGCLHRRL